MTFDSLRARRHVLVRLLLPILLLNWVGAAALPCAAMDASAAAVDGIHAAAANVAEASLHAHHEMQGASETHSHPACPHCAHDTDGSSSGDAAAHAACGEAPVNQSNETHRPSAKQDLGIATPLIPRAVVAARSDRRYAKIDPSSIPPPRQALYLTHCVFLN